MRLCLLAVAAVIASAGSAAAQRPGPRITWGEGYGVTPVGGLAPGFRDEVRDDTGTDVTAVGFLYYRWFLFADGFNFWTADGEYVLVGPDGYLPLGTEGQQAMAEAVGHHKPLGYRLVFGWLGVVAGVATVWVLVRRSPESRVERLGRDPRYAAAFVAYTAALPDDGPPTADHRRAGLAAGVDLLADEYAVPERRAERNLRLVARQAEKAMSFEMRAAALAHEEAGDLGTAAELFEQAAHYGAFWEPIDHTFIQKNLARVRAKLAVGQAGAGPPLSDEAA